MGLGEGRARVPRRCLERGERKRVGGKISSTRSMQWSIFLSLPLEGKLGIALPA